MLLFPKRHSRWILALSLAGSLWIVKELVDTYNTLPPLYSQYHWQEMALPQHSGDLAYPDDSSRKFLWISGHARGLGKWFHRRESFVYLLSPLAHMFRLGERPAGAFYAWLPCLRLKAIVSQLVPPMLCPPPTLVVVQARFQ
jgi:hypothetical protein